MGQRALEAGRCVANNVRGGVLGSGSLGRRLIWGWACSPSRLLRVRFQLMATQVDGTGPADRAVVGRYGHGEPARQRRLAGWDAGGSKSKTADAAASAVICVSDRSRPGQRRTDGGTGRYKQGGTAVKRCRLRNTRQSCLHGSRTLTRDAKRSILFFSPARSRFFPSPSTLFGSVGQGQQQRGHTRK